MLTLDQLSKHFKRVRAVDRVSLEIREGEALGLVGPNGSGKSTLLRMVLGITRPTSGRVLVQGEVLSGKSWRRFKRRVGYMPERVSFYDNLTGMETLKLFARVKGGCLAGLDEVLPKILPVGALRRKVGEYSKGMRQRLNFAQALLNDPDILVLDEPTSGFDPVGTREFYEILDGVRERKALTVILSSHILAEIEEKVDRVAVMKNGSLKAVGRIEDLCTNLEIPLKLTLTIHHRDEVIERLLKREGARDLSYKNGYLLANVPSENKIAVMSAIMEEKERFEDLSLREPSLEEVFFGVH